MGGAVSTSSVKNISNQLFIDQSTVNQLNQQLNNVVANTIIKSAMNSGGAIINQQQLNFTDLKAQGDVTIGNVSQKQVAAVTFSAMNQTQATNDAATNFIQTALDTLNNNTSTDVKTMMDSNASSSLKSGFLSTLPGQSNSSKSATINQSNVTAVTQNTQNIKNILQNTVTNNFTTDTVTNCITNINNSQTFKVQDVQSQTGTIRIMNITQDQAATAIAQCGAVTTATNNIVNQTLNGLGVKVDNTNSVASTTQQTGQTTASTQANGPLEGLASIIGSITAPFTSVMTIIILLIIATVIIVGGYILYKMFAGGSTQVTIATPSTSVPISTPTSV